MVELYCEGMRLYRAEFNIVELYCGKHNRLYKAKFNIVKLYCEGMRFRSGRV